MIELARRLVERGHVVHVLGSDSIADRASRAGAEPSAFQRAVFDFALTRIEDDLDSFRALLASPATAFDCIEAINRTGADTVVVDCMLPAAIAAATAHARASATLIHLRYSCFTEPEPEIPLESVLLPVLEATLDELKLPALTSGGSALAEVWNRTNAALTPIPEILESPITTTPQRLVRVGPLIESVADVEDTADSEPAACVISLSTTQMEQGSCVQRAIDAVSELGVHGVCTTGLASLGPLVARPSVQILDWADHGRLFARARVGITHAGMGTVLVALKHGVPLVCLPMGRDQNGNAARIAELGAGVVLSPESSSSAIADAASLLLSDSTYRERAMEIAREIEPTRALDAVKVLEWL